MAETTQAKLEFSNASNEAIADFAVSNQGEFGCDGITREDILGRITDGHAVIERWDYGFAIIEVRNVWPHLWLLYVLPEQRRQGLGRQFVRRLLQRYASEYHMTLKCYGAQRRRFFGRCGFRIESRDSVTGLREMTTNPTPY